MNETRLIAAHYSDKLAHVEVVINCPYSVAQSALEKTLGLEGSSALQLMSYLLNTMQPSIWVTLNSPSLPGFDLRTSPTTIRT